VWWNLEWHILPGSTGVSILRNTFKHASVYILAAMASRLIGFIMLPFYANILRDVGYGVIGMLDTTMAFLLVLLAYGLRGTLIRFYHEETGDDKLQVISTGVLLVAGAALVLALPVLAFSRPLTALLIGDASKNIFLCMALGAFYLDLVGESATSLMLIWQRSGLFSFISLFRLCVGLSLNIYLIVILRWGLYGYFTSVLLTSLVSNSLFLAYAFRHCGLKFNRRIARNLIRYQAPLVPGSLATYVSRMIERVLVRFWIGLGGVGVLEMGYKFPPLLTLLFARPFMRSWETKRVEIAESGAPDAPLVIGSMFTYFLFVMIFLGLLVAVNIADILKVLTPPEFWLAHRIAQIEVLTVIFSAVFMNMSFGLLYMKDTRSYSIILGVTSILKVGLSFIFIKLWGLYGAAFSGCTVTMIQSTCSLVVSQRQYHIPWQYRKIAIMAGVAVALFLLLTNIDFGHTALAADFERRQLPAIVAWLRTTPLGEWKDGKVPEILVSKTPYLLDMLGKVLGCCLFLVLAPYVHPPYHQALRRRFFSLAGVRR